MVEGARLSCRRWQEGRGGVRGRSRRCISGKHSSKFARILFHICGSLPQNDKFLHQNRDFCISACRSFLSECTACVTPAQHRPPFPFGGSQALKVQFMARRSLHGEVFLARREACERCVPPRRRLGGGGRHERVRMRVCVCELRASGGVRASLGVTCEVCEAERRRVHGGAGVARDRRRRLAPERSDTPSFISGPPCIPSSTSSCAWRGERVRSETSVHGP